VNGLLGHEAQRAAMQAAMASGRLHHAWLLYGPQGVGKARFADLVAARLLADASATPPMTMGLDVPDDHPTARLIAAGSHPDLIVLRRIENEKTGNLARSITVDQIRALKSVFASTPSQGERRVVIVDSIDDLERGGANALLKSLEEPPASTIFLLVSHAPGRLLPTIRSRCRALAFERLPDDVMATILAREAPELDGMTRAVVLAAANGAPGAALSMLEEDIAGLDAALRELATTGDPHNVLRLELASKLSLKAAQPRYAAFLRRAPAYLARQARSRSGPALAEAIASWEAARELADTAVAQSLVPESVVFEIAGRVAALAPKDARAKA
jgi:DNA polymerase-3 subunit delta'